MRVIILFSVALILSIHFSFAQQAFTMEELKYYIPSKEQKFKLAKVDFVLNDTSVVSINAVYVHIFEEEERVNYNVVRTVKSYTYMRFFKDGRVYFSFPYLSFPKVEEFNDLNYGKYGRYIIDEKGKIKIELYMDKQSGIMLMYAENKLSDIQFYKSSGMIGRDTSEGFYKKEFTNLYTWPK